MEIKGLREVVAKLRAKAAEAKKDSNASVIVGYTQNYAIFVHENLEAHHPVGEAKFLEGPARENAKEYSAMITKALKEGKTMAQSLLIAGLTLQRDSQQRCPVLTGALKGSAFTRLVV